MDGDTRRNLFTMKFNKQSVNINIRVEMLDVVASTTIDKIILNIKLYGQQIVIKRPHMISNIFYSEHDLILMYNADGVI